MVANLGTDSAPNTWIWWATLVIEDLFMLCSILSFIPLWLIYKHLKRIANALVKESDRVDQVIHVFDDKPKTFETSIQGDRVKVTQVED